MPLTKHKLKLCCILALTLIAGLLPNLSCSSGEFGQSTAGQILLPGVTQQVPQMFSYIRSQLNADVPAGFGVSNPDSTRAVDLYKVDLIYTHALERSRGDHLRACALAGLACLTHRKIPLRFGLRVPLTWESDSAHGLRLKMLPARLFSDTPASGDADKLQHFFLSAYLALRSDSPSLANLSGHIIEGGESVLISEQENDARDIMANALGRRFARHLQMDITTSPSEVLRQADQERE